MAVKRPLGISTKNKAIAFQSACITFYYFYELKLASQVWPVEKCVPLFDTIEQEKYVVAK